MNCKYCVSVPIITGTYSSIYRHDGHIAYMYVKKTYQANLSFANAWRFHMIFSSISSGAVEETPEAIEMLATLVKGLRMTTGTQKSSTRLVYWSLQNLQKYVKA